MVVRYLRFRRGPDGEHDNLTLASTSYNVVIDHNSISWSTDENINTYRDVQNVTFSWNLIAEPLHCSALPTSCHGKNGAMGKYETGNQSVHHNLLMSSHDRSLQMNQVKGVADYVNNVHYNLYDPTYFRGDDIPSGAFVGMNFVGNWYAYGPQSKLNGSYPPEIRIKGSPPEEMKLYVKGNIGPRRPDDSKPEWAIVGSGQTYQSTTRFDAPPVTTTSAQSAYEQVLAGAGATLPERDAVDVRLVMEVESRTGQWVNHPDEVGGYPVIEGGTAPTDSDMDGMPDEWERAYGFDSQVPDDDKVQPDGYTALEHYLAWLERN